MHRSGDCCRETTALSQVSGWHDTRFVRELAFPENHAAAISHGAAPGPREEIRHSARTGRRHASNTLGSMPDRRSHAPVVTPVDDLCVQTRTSARTTGPGSRVRPTAASARVPECGASVRRVRTPSPPRQSSRRCRSPCAPTTQSLPRTPTAPGTHRNRASRERTG